MKISILGGGGFLGQRLAIRLAADGHLGGKPIAALTLFDIAPPPAPKASFAVHCLAGDIAELPVSESEISGENRRNDKSVFARVHRCRAFLIASQPTATLPIATKSFFPLVFSLEASSTT